MSDCESFPSTTKSCFSGQIYCWILVIIFIYQSDNFITLWKVLLAEVHRKALLYIYTNTITTTDLLSISTSTLVSKRLISYQSRILLKIWVFYNSIWNYSTSSYQKSWISQIPNNWHGNSSTILVSRLCTFCSIKHVCAVEWEFILFLYSMLFNHPLSTETKIASWKGKENFLRYKII